MKKRKTNFGVLIYKLDTCTIFEKAPAVSGQNEVGNFELENEELQVELKHDYNTIKEARNAVSQTLKSWQIEDEILWKTTSGFRFVYVKAIFPQSTDQLSNLPEELKYIKDYNETLIIASCKYPPFPETLFTYEMESAWVRYRKVKIGIGESIQSASYYLLTVVVNFTGENMKKAASILFVDYKILKKIGELTSIRGNNFTSRKSLSRNTLELSIIEKHWLDIAVKNILIQAATMNGDRKPSRIELNDLPNLQNTTHNKSYTQ